jgi:hypothetical protein
VSAIARDERGSHDDVAHDNIAGDKGSYDTTNAYIVKQGWYRGQCMAGSAIWHPISLAPSPARTATSDDHAPAA